MLSPDDPQARHLVTGVVRDIAAGTGFTTITRIGEVGGTNFSVNISFLPTATVDYGVLLHAITDLERETPTSLPVSACALILPERDVAYIKHGTAPMTTLTVGPNPHDDPDTHRVVEEGLAAYMQALLDAQPAHRPTGRPFRTQPGPTPNTARPHRPLNGATFPHPDHDIKGPHR